VNEAAATTGGAERRTLWLLAAGGAFLVLPIWVVQRLPLLDGPCHLYNAWVLHHLTDPRLPQIGAHFELILEPLPNLASQALLYLLLFVLPPAAAEQVLLTAYVALFLAAAWTFAGCVDAARRGNALLALPFAWNLFASWGFHNFVLSLPLYLVAVGYWWRRHRMPTWRFAAAINGLLVLLYFTHLVSLVAALVTLGVIWLWGWRWVVREGSWRRHLVHPLILLPQVALPLGYLLAHPTAPRRGPGGIGDDLAYLARLGPLFPREAQWRPGYFVAALLLLLIAGTLLARRRGGEGDGEGRLRREDGFLAAAVILVALYLAAPAGVAGGDILPQRLVLYPCLVLLPWIAVGGRRLGAILGLALVATSAAQGVQLTARHRRLAAAVDEYLHGMESVRPGTRLVTLIWGRSSTPARTLLGHAVGHLAIERGLIDWDDYQAASTVFPVRFRPGLRRPPTDVIEARPDDYAVYAWKPVVDAVYTWGMPPESRLRERLERHYRLVATHGEGRLYERRGRGPARAAPAGLRAPARPHPAPAPPGPGGT
jgi:hypothetical protein